ncbi:hypothetical protein P7K49_020222 [Saguinus oedipus]|uniref:Uncharacterized protein n=1 Tax=Saguinus oedipus TaxID=9490 RepID=A0ABQ9V0J5_SAGOE|nr:hypothetical protein P7K49_020222 [Saguinus oedipus]
MSGIIRNSGQNHHPSPQEYSDIREYGFLPEMHLWRAFTVGSGEELGGRNPESRCPDAVQEGFPPDSAPEFWPVHLGHSADKLYGALSSCPSPKTGQGKQRTS